MTKIIYMGREVNGRYSSFKTKVRRFVKKVVSLSFKAAVIYAALLIGILVAPQVPEMVVQAETSVPPIMQRIAKCETNNQHYGKSGQVLMTGNTNKSVDVGRYAINSVWFTKATEMGLDLTDEEDNETFALWLYAERGTGDWYPSQHCWKK